MLEYLFKKYMIKITQRFPWSSTLPYPHTQDVVWINTLTSTYSKDVLEFSLF